MIPDICSVLDISEHELISGANDTEYHEMKRRRAHIQEADRDILLGLHGRVCAGAYYMFHMRPRGESQVYFFPRGFRQSVDRRFRSFRHLRALPKSISSRCSRARPISRLSCCLSSCCAKYGQNWFGAAALGTLLGYIAVFAPFLLRRYMPARDADLFPPYTFCCSSPA